MRIIWKLKVYGLPDINIRMNAYNIIDLWEISTIKPYTGVETIMWFGNAENDDCSQCDVRFAKRVGYLLERWIWVVGLVLKSWIWFILLKR